MRVIIYSTIVIATTLFIPFRTSNIRKQQFSVEPVARWTGFLTMDEKMTWNEGCISMTSERHVKLNFTNTLPTLYRNDGAIDFSAYTDNKGPGTAEFHSEGTMCGQKGKTDCSITGEAELHNVTVREWDNTYDIEAIAPPCNGTNIDGSPYGPDIMEISVSNERLTSRDHLAGTKTTTSQVTGTTATVTRTTTWHLERVKEDIYLIVTPENYDSWMPEPGRDERTAGPKKLKIALKLQKRNGQAPLLRATSFELTLSNTSHEPGIAINYPVNPGTAKPDLRFQWQPAADTSSDGQKLTINCSSPCLTGTAFIGAYDGGAYSTLTVIAVLEDSSRLVGNLKIPGGEQSISIPKRDPNSMIATSWLQANGNPGDTDDNDHSTDNNNHGDGLSAYEEYRGVIAETVFKRLSPEKKELGVWMKKRQVPIFSEGLVMLENAADIRVVRLIENEMDADRVFNRNKKTANVFKQYVEKLDTGSIAGDAVGENHPIGTTAKTPETSTKVIIDTKKISIGYNDQVAALRTANQRYHMNLTMPYTLKEEIANTVAHELAHGINANHHGLPTSSIPNIRIPQNTQGYRVFDMFNNEITAPGFLVDGLIGRQGNDESGNLECIMAYTHLYNWVHRADQGTLDYYAIPLMPVGKTLCRSTDGKGINANGKYFGNGSMGNCIGELKFK